MGIRFIRHLFIRWHTCKWITLPDLAVGRLPLAPSSLSTSAPIVFPSVSAAQLISITRLHRRDKSVCQRDIIIKLFQRSFNIAEAGLRSSPWKIGLKYDLCVRDELWNKTFRGKMNCPATWNSLAVANWVTSSARILPQYFGGRLFRTLPEISMAINSWWELTELHVKKHRLLPTHEYIVREQGVLIIN